MICLESRIVNIEGAGNIATALIAEVTLVEQPKGKELEYRIIAISKAGEGLQSNTVIIVL